MHLHLARTAQIALLSHTFTCDANRAAHLPHIAAPSLVLTYLGNQEASSAQQLRLWYISCRVGPEEEISTPACN